MDFAQRKAAYEAAEAMLNNREEYQPEVELDASAVDNAGFDSVEDGVWIQAWVKVPASLIDGYAMQPPAAPSNVSSVRVMDYIQFRTAYVGERFKAADPVIEEDIESSWKAYQRDPAGHFLSKPS